MPSKSTKRSTSNTAEDEAIALALQDELRREAVQAPSRSTRRSSRSPTQRTRQPSPGSVAPSSLMSSRRSGSPMTMQFTRPQSKPLSGTTTRRSSGAAAAAAAAAAGGSIVGANTARTSTKSSIRPSSKSPSRLPSRPSSRSPSREPSNPSNSFAFPRTPSRPRPSAPVETAQPVVPSSSRHVDKNKQKSGKAFHSVRPSTPPTQPNTPQSTRSMVSPIMTYLEQRPQSGRSPSPPKVNQSEHQKQGLWFQKKNSAGSNRSITSDTKSTRSTRSKESNQSKRSTESTDSSNSFSNFFNRSFENISKIFIDQQQQEDEALARRLEQEMRDEEMANNLARAERASRSFDIGGTVGGTARSGFSRGSRDSFVESPREASSSSSSPSSCRGKAWYYSTRILAVLLVMSVCFVVFLMLFGGRADDALDPSSWLPGWPDADPGLGSVGEVNLWDTDGEYKGLSLHVLNNLDAGSDWKDHFLIAISEWDNGTPDAVTLNVRQMANYDPDCRAVRKAMKVCNGDYGPTDWRGVNQILLQDDYIITSLAKMNDYYLEGTNRAQKQYTICHELGHGLGLGHVDENFYNKDLGNCMDYTERPQNNMSPNESNFITLEEMYGNIDGSSVMSSKLKKGEEVEKTDMGEKGDNDSKREEGKQRQREKKKDQDDRRTESLIDRERLLDEEFEKHAAYLSDPIITSRSTDEHSGSREGWRVLRKTDMAEYHERKLGNGFTIRTSVLLA